MDARVQSPLNCPIAFKTLDEETGQQSKVGSTHHMVHPTTAGGLTLDNIGRPLDDQSIQPGSYGRGAHLNPAFTAASPKLTPLASPREASLLSLLKARRLAPTSSSGFFPRPHPTLQMAQQAEQMRRDLDKLRVEYEAANWTNGHEPIIGSPDCPVLAEDHGIRGKSCYVVFVYKKGDGSYGCRHKNCFQDGSDRAPSSRSLTEAIRHQRKHHF